MTDEFELIDWIRRQKAAHPQVPIGIGDDAALLRSADGKKTLITVDLLIEGVHFTLPPATARTVGRKVMAVNLSDIAAMAGRPTAAVVSEAIPQNSDPDFGRDLHRGLQELADEFGVAIIGGDTNSWNGPLVVSVTLLGEVTGSNAVTRGGAQPGDWILTTGDFGGSLAGRHLNFSPRVAEAQRLHQSANLHAMIDVSDGLAADLHHILDESRVGAVLHSANIPISNAAHAMNDDKSPLDHALGDGEDFELLLTVSPEEARQLLDAPPIDVPLTHIGEIVTGTGCDLIDPTGDRHPLPRIGWKHPL